MASEPLLLYLTTALAGWWNSPNPSQGEVFPVQTDHPVLLPGSEARFILLSRMGRSRSNSPATNYRGTYRVSKAKKPKKGKRRRRKGKWSNGDDDDEGYGGGDGNQVHNYDIEVSVIEIDCHYRDRQKCVAVC